MEIEIERKPSKARLDALGVDTWPIWEKEVSAFPWQYAEQETCYILEGEVTVTPAGGEATEIRSGDLVVFPAGMSCTWRITRDLRKHYRMG